VIFLYGKNISSSKIKKEGKAFFELIGIPFKKEDEKKK